MLDAKFVVRPKAFSLELTVAGYGFSKNWRLGFVAQPIFDWGAGSTAVVQRMSRLKLVQLNGAGVMR